ncbi:MAG: hypothetical protein WCO99_08925 [Planctomycetota bacterium]
MTSLLRRPIYRGEEVFRTKFSKRELRTGRSKLVWNTADGVLTRKSEHLRMVSDWLWYRANAVIDRRCTRLHPPRGPEHPLAGKPRDSRKLLSTLFVCGICGGLMHAEGRNEGGSHRRGSTGPCHPAESSRRSDPGGAPPAVRH